MFGNLGTAIRFFAIGLGVGMLMAPRRGEETRALLQQRFREIGDVFREAEGAMSGASGASNGQAAGRRGEQQSDESTQTGQTFGPQTPQA